MPTPQSTSPTAGTFGALLRQLRRRAGLTQGELAALVGFSISQISLLEKNQRLPDLATVSGPFARALSLDAEPHLLQRLVELAAQARGERLPLAIRVERTVTVETSVSQEWIEEDSRLPSPSAPLLGRERLIDDAITRLTQSSGRLLTLLGPPGVGKTRLALEIAAHLQALYTDGVCSVPLAGVEHPAQLGAALAAALAVREVRQRTPQQRLVDHLRRRRMLLVLDDFEHLLSPVPNAAKSLLVDLLAACPDIHLLVTSREPLRLRAEQRLKVPPLSPAAAVELFLQRAEAVDPEFTISPRDLPSVAGICLHLDCLPLAVELIAARIDLLSPQAMLARLQENPLDLLGDGPADLPPHQQTLRRAIQRSYALLDTAEQRLFRHCSIFAGGFDLAAAEACLPWSDIPARLQSLLAKSLVKASGGEDGERRFVLLETLRAFALEQLAALGEAPAQEERHARYYAALAQALAAQAAGVTGSAAGSDLRRAAGARQRDEVQNIMAALQWLLHHDNAEALPLVTALRPFWYATGRFDEGRTWTQAALAAAPSPDTLEKAAARAGALLTLGQMLLNQGDTAAARRSLDEALALYRQAGDRRGSAQCLIELGWAVYLAHAPKESIPFFVECLSLAQELGDSGLTAHALTSLSHVLVYEGSYTPQLLVYVEQSLELYRRLQDPHGVSQALLNLSVYHTQTGAYEKALAAACEAEVVVRGSELASAQAWTHSTIAELLLLQGLRLDEAQEHLEAALALFREANQREGVLIVEHHLGDLARRREAWAEALMLYEKSLAAAIGGDDRRMQARCRIGLGLTALAQDDVAEARQHLEEAAALLETLPAFLPPGAQAEFAAARARTGIT